MLFALWCHSQRVNESHDRLITASFNRGVWEVHSQWCPNLRRWAKSTNIKGRCTTSRWPLVEAQSEPHGKTPWASHFTRYSSASFSTTMACKTRQVGRMTEDIQSRILLEIRRIVSAPYGQDRTSLLEVSPSSRRPVTIPEKLVSWFPAARKRGEWRLSVMVFSLRHCLELLLVKIHLLLQVLREKTRASAVSEVSGPCKSVMDLFQPFTHDGSVSLSTDTSNSIPIKILTGTGAPQSLLLTEMLCFLRSRPLVRVF